jgi:hypothetical protein
MKLKTPTPPQLFKLTQDKRTNNEATNKTNKAKRVKNKERKRELL